MNVGTITQQPSERLSYTVNYEDALLEGDQLQGATATVSPAGLTVDNIGVYTPRLKVWLEGGTSGRTYKVELNVTTVQGRRFQDELTVKIKES